MRALTIAQAIYLAVSALTLAAFVHLSTVWLVPRFAERDAYATTVRLAGLDETKLVKAGAGASDPFPYLDPATPAAFCRYDLSRGPERATLPLGRPGFLSVSFHDSGGVAWFALTDRAATGGKIEAVLVTPKQLKALQARDDEENPSQELRITAPGETGFAFARALAESPSLTPEAESAAKALACRVEPLPP